MKKLFIVLLSIGGYFNAFSQEKGSFELGIVGGYNGSTVTTNTATNSTLVSGFNAGIFGDYFFSDRWSIKGKLSYDQKGWGNGYFTGTFYDQNYQQDIKKYDHVDYHVDYLTIPIMANWHFGSKRNWYLNFGPYAGFLLSADQTATQYPELKEFFNKIDKLSDEISRMLDDGVGRNIIFSFIPGILSLLKTFKVLLESLVKKLKLSLVKMKFEVLTITFFDFFTRSFPKGFGKK